MTPDDNAWRNQVQQQADKLKATIKGYRYAPNETTIACLDIERALLMCDKAVETKEIKHDKR